MSNEEIQRAKQLRDQVTGYRKTLSVILVAKLGLTADHVAHILGTSRRTVFRDRGNIRNQDDTAKNSWGGRRHCSMTFEEEREFLAQWEKLATVLFAGTESGRANMERTQARLLCKPCFRFPECRDRASRTGSGSDGG
jgi:hypothetical protein